MSKWDLYPDELTWQMLLELVPYGRSQLNNILTPSHKNYDPKLKRYVREGSRRVFFIKEEVRAWLGQWHPECGSDEKLGNFPATEKRQGASRKRPSAKVKPLARAIPQFELMSDDQHKGQQSSSAISDAVLEIEPSIADETAAIRNYILRRARTGGVPRVEEVMSEAHLWRDREADWKKFEEALRIISARSHEELGVMLGLLVFDCGPFGYSPLPSPVASQLEQGLQLGYAIGSPEAYADEVKRTAEFFYESLGLPVVPVQRYKRQRLEWVQPSSLWESPRLAEHYCF